MVKKLFLLLIVLLIPLLAACKIEKEDTKKLKELDFTILKESEIPEKLKGMIEEKKTGEFKATYEDGEALYIVVGCGAQQTSGYSIAVNELYLTSNAVYIDTNLIGPSKDEKKKETETYPYIVVKTEYREEPVVFQ